MGTRAAGATSDLLVNGARYDVYTPTTNNIDNIISQIASKGSQVQGGGVIVDLGRTDVTAADLANAEARVRGITPNVTNVIILPY